MRVELMEFKRCCCCIPLRYGLLISGYFKLMVSVAILVPAIIQMVESGKAFQRSDKADDIKSFVSAFTLLLLVIFVTLGDIAMTIVFVIGNHKKNSRLLRIYNKYSIGLLVTYVLGFVLFVAYIMYLPISGIWLIYAAMTVRVVLAFVIVDICLQVYFILMTKSEIAKLENNCQFQFTNNAMEAQCTMNDVGANETNGTCIVNSEQVDQNEYINENEENYPKENNLNGSNARFN